MTKFKTLVKSYFLIGTWIIGILAGLPWISVGLSAGSAVHSSLIGWLIAISVVISYDATTIWVLLEIEKIISSKIFNSSMNFPIQKIGKEIHIICNLVGVISTIPTFYISWIFNRCQISYSLLAASITYIFSIFGVYKIYILVIAPLLNNRKEKKKIITQQKEKKHKLIAILKLFLILYFPLADLIFQSAIILNIFKNAMNIAIFFYFFMPFIVLPLYGLNLFSMKSLSDFISLVFIRFMEKFNHKLKTRNFLILPLLILSGFSACTNAYVAYEQINQTAFSFMAVIVTMSVWFSQTILQVLGLYHITLLIWQFLKGLKSHFFTIPESSAN